MHKWFAVMAILALSATTAVEAQRGRGQGPGGGGRGGAPAGFSGPVAGHGVDVPGWWARLDDPAQVMKGGLKFAPVNNTNIQAMTGAASGIFWDPDQTRSDKYTVKAKFTLSKVPAAQEPFGLLIGGQNLSEDNQRYTLFVLRPDGRYLISRRTGAKTMNVGGDWADHAAVMKAEAGRMANELSVQVAATTVTFMANGKTVATHPTTAVDANGVAGLRLGRGLDVLVEGFALE
jgi:hypothetical protein